MTAHDSIHVAAVLTAVILLFVLLEMLRRLARITSELVRKLAHVGTGLLAISFPWIFSTAPPVLIVCVLAALLMLAFRYLPLTRRVAGVLHSVGRDSLGEIYFPVSVALLLALSHGNRLLYIVPLLTLTFADSAAALVGTRYGRTRYALIGAAKSLEGSAAFFAAAFLCIHIPLLLDAHVRGPHSVLIALAIALLATLLEAIASWGLDNLLVPLGVFLLLRIDSTMTTWGLALQVAAAIVLALLFVRSRFLRTSPAGVLLTAALVFSTAIARLL